MIVVGPGIIQALDKESAQKPMTIYSSIGGLGLLLGPTLGGLVIHHWHWQGVFWINIPCIIIGFILCLFVLPHSQSKFKQSHHILYKLDLLGNLLIFINLDSLIYTILELEQAGWNHLSIIAGIIFIISLPCLILVEKKHEMPTLDLSHFKNRHFRLAVLCNLTAGSLVSCRMFFSPLFLQTVMHYTPAMAGVILLAFAIVILLGAPIVGALPKKISDIHFLLTALFTSVISVICYIIFFNNILLWIGIAAFAFTGFVLAINNTFSALSIIKGLGEEKAGTSIGTIFATFNIMAALMLGLASLLFHRFSYPKKYPINHAYMLTFCFVFVVVLVIAIIGWATRKESV